MPCDKFFNLLVIRFEMKDKIESMIRKNNGAVEVINALSKDASFRVVMENDADIVISREGGSFTVSNFKSGQSPDFTVFSTFDITSRIFNSCGRCSDVKKFLINSTKILMDKENRKHISLSVHKGFLTLTMHGYLKLLAMGGTQFIKTLADHGIDSVNTIRKKLTSLTNRLN